MKRDGSREQILADDLGRVAESLRREWDEVRTSGGEDSDVWERLTDRYVILHPRLATALRQLDVGSPPVAADGTPTVVQPGEATPALPAGVPEHLGTYRLLRVLGRGGMGVVYLARDETMDRLAAVKILPREKAGEEEVVRRFDREAVATTELEHPSIVPVYEVGVDRGWRYYAMGYVEGESLKEWVARLRTTADSEDTSAAQRTGPTWLSALPFVTSVRRAPARSLTPAETDRLLRIVEQTARALHHAHQQGIIHRDVKPSNIMVDREGMAHLLDFGLAKVATADSMTDTGRILGTLPYMSPEQLSSKRGEVDHRTDVYSLGVTLYEGVTGRRPFNGETPDALILQALMKPAPSPREFVPDLAPSLETVILECLEKNPARRYATAEDLAEDVARIRAHKRIEAVAVGRLGRVGRWAARNRKLATLAAALLIVVVAIPVVILWRGFADERERESHAREARTEAAADADRRRELARELETVRLDLEAARRQAPSYAPVSEPRKQRALELAARSESIERERRELALRAGFAWDRAIELAEIEGAPRDELVEFVRELALEAEDDRDAEAREVADERLKQLRARPPVPGRGLVTFTTFPEGARASIHRITREANGLWSESEGPVFTGPTPLLALELETGSYVAVLRRDGHNDVRYPFVVERGEHWGHPSWHGGIFRDRDWSIQIGTKASYDGARWVHVPAGPFLATVDREDWSIRVPTTWRWVDGFLIERDETTYGRYDEFFSLPETQAEIIRAMKEDQKATLVPRTPQVGRVLPTIETRYTNPRKSEFTFGIRDEARDQAVSGITHTDAMRYAAWLSESSEHDHSLPTGTQWEKAARGVDGRPFPWGDEFEWTRVQSWDPALFAISLPGAPGGAPDDVSPYGVRDMGGNAAEWCLDGPDLHEEHTNPWLCGGDASRRSAGPSFFTVWPRFFTAFDNVDSTWGVRLVRGIKARRSGGKKR